MRKDYDHLKPQQRRLLERGDKIIRPATGVLTKEGVRPQPRHPGEGRDPVANKKPPSATSGPPGPRPSPG